MGVKHVKAFGDSLLVVYQVSEKYQCLDGSLNAHLDKCLDNIARFDEFSIHHIYRHENSKANGLAQHASGYNVSSKNFSITKKSMCMHVPNLFLSVLGANTSLTCSTAGLIGVLDIQTNLTDTPIDLTDPVVPDNSVLEDSTSNNLEHDKVDVIDLGSPIIDYLQDLSQKVDTKVQWLAFKFTLVEEKLYRQTVDDLLLKFLDSD
jgi:hypothetical protein